MRLSAIAKHRAGTTFVFIFFIVFVVGSALLIPRIINVYEGIVNRSDITHSISVPLLQLSGAVKRGDSFNSVCITELTDGTDALKVKENGIYWLYYSHDGYLYRQNANKKESSAQRLCEAGSLYLTISSGLIKADYTAADGSKHKLLICPRTGITNGG